MFNYISKEHGENSVTTRSKELKIPHFQLVTKGRVRI